MLLLQVGDSTAWYGKCPGDGSVRAVDGTSVTTYTFPVFPVKRKKCQAGS